MTYYAKEEDFNILTNAKTFEFIQTENSLNYKIKCDMYESEQNINKFTKVIQYFEKDYKLLIDCIFAKYFSNSEIDEIMIEQCFEDKYNIIKVNCANTKKLIIKFNDSKKIDYIIKKLIEWKNYHFWERYKQNKGAINNIIFLQGELNSYTTYVKNDNSTPKGNNLYISINNIENSVNLKNNDLGDMIINDFYITNKGCIDGINYTEQNTILMFNNNKKIYICNGYYNDFVNMVENDLIDKKIGKVYKKGD